MELEWRVVPNWPKYLVSINGGIYSYHTKRYLKVNKVGQICLGGGKVKRSVNPGVLVLEAFVGPCPEGMECCHNDDDRANNKLYNLRWDTHKSNMQDRDYNGNTVHLFGEHNGHSILTDANVLEAIALRTVNPRFWTFARLGARYGVSYRTVSYAVSGHHWSHLHKL